MGPVSETLTHNRLLIEILSHANPSEESFDAESGLYTGHARAG